MAKRKSQAEAKTERITWFLLVLIFGVLSVAQDNLPPDQTLIPNWIVPISGAVVLLASGMYQYTRRWRVSPITWIAAVVLLMFGLVNLFIDQTLDLTGLALITFAIVIAFGLLTGET